MAPPGPSVPERGLKRSLEGDERDGRPPTKGPRLDRDGQFSRYGRNEGNRSSWGSQSVRMGLNGRGDFMDGGMGMRNGNLGVQNGQSRYQPPGTQRGICRDYFSESPAAYPTASQAHFPQTTGIVLAVLSASLATAMTQLFPLSCSQ